MEFDIFSIGVVYFPAIAVIVYVLVELIKAGGVDGKWYPGIAGVLGIVLGIVCILIRVPDFPAGDLVTAAAIGGLSGLAATGADQLVKKLKGQ